MDLVGISKSRVPLPALGRRPLSETAKDVAGKGSSWVDPTAQREEEQRYGKKLIKRLEERR